MALWQNRTDQSSNLDSATNRLCTLAQVTGCWQLQLDGMHKCLAYTAVVITHTFPGANCRLLSHPLEMPHRGTDIRAFRTPDKVLCHRTTFLVQDSARLTHTPYVQMAKKPHTRKNPCHRSSSSPSFPRLAIIGMMIAQESRISLVGRCTSNYLSH